MNNETNQIPAPVRRTVGQYCAGSMRKTIWALIFTIGIIPAFILTVPAILFMVAIFDGWCGYHADPDHLPIVWWHNWTERNAVRAAYLPNTAIDGSNPSEQK